MASKLINIAMNTISGTEGYRTSVDRFIAATESIDFNTSHRPYLNFIPTKPSHVLDIGAGVGRDASVLASMGHVVTAVEPLPDFLDIAKTMHSSQHIQWIEDSLPDLAEIRKFKETYEFVLASAVWHHINDVERSVAMSHIAGLLSVGGIFALSLRNGPAGVGTHTFPTDVPKTIELAMVHGLEAIIVLTEQPSLVGGKDTVKWAKLAFRRS